MKRQFLELSYEKLKKEQEKEYGSIMAFRIKITDKKKNRFTDAYMEVKEHRGKIYFTLIHERGYPSEQKGSTIKQVVGNWLSYELPKIK